MVKKNHGKLKCKGPKCQKTIHLRDGKSIRKKVGKKVKCPFCGHNNEIVRKKNGKTALECA